MKSNSHQWLASLMVEVLLGAALLLAALFYMPVAQAEYGDIVLNKRAGLAGMRPVIFPHWFHRIRFRCRVCHIEAGFEMRAGSNDIYMLDIMEGRFCGQCHNNRIAWGPENCLLCHSGLPGLKGGVQRGSSTGGPSFY